MDLCKTELTGGLWSNLYDSTKMYMLSVDQKRRRRYFVSNDQKTPPHSNDLPSTPHLPAMIMRHKRFIIFLAVSLVLVTNTVVFDVRASSSPEHTLPTDPFGTYLIPSGTHIRGQLTWPQLAYSGPVFT